MFLDSILARNNQLVSFAVKAHQDGLIGANTYVVDLDTVENNAKALHAEAQKHGIELYMMTKQFGRNPEVAKRIAKQGIKKVVAVDPWEAKHLYKHGIEIGHVGHLVQIPSGLVKEVVSYQPDVITVFSYEMALEISDYASELGLNQGIILRVYEDEASLYEGQKGGFALKELEEVVPKLMALKGVSVHGVTTFPCFLYKAESGQLEATDNVLTLNKAKCLLESFGLDIIHVNMPSATCCETIGAIKSYGGTHGEPGHALTGSTPFHINNRGVEQPAMLYVSEVSHQDNEHTYVFGGGFYNRSQAKKAMVYPRQTSQAYELEIIPHKAEAIDYYGVLKREQEPLTKGDTVIYAFRTQVFVTRSEVVLVEGLTQKNPRIVGVYNALGHLISEV